jgi:preprotein translocase SecE subunit
MEWWNKTKQFLAEVRAEISKCYFPGRDEVVQTTIVVLVTSFVFAAFLALSDVVITAGIDQVFRLGS